MCACAPSAQVLYRAPGPALSTQRVFFVQPIRFETMRVGRLSAAEWEGRKSAWQRAHVAGDERRMSADLVDRLAARDPELLISGSPEPGAWVVQPIVTFIEPARPSRRR